MPLEIDNQHNKLAKKIGIKIRPMEIDDIPRVFHMGEDLFEAEKFPSLYRVWDEHEVIELFHGDPEFNLVAELKDEIVGFALGTTITKSRSAWKYGYLVWLGVDKAFQRMGIAEKLFKRFMDLMLKEGVRIILVDTAADNLQSLRFFRKMGFGSPTQHIYLSMNLDSQKNADKKNHVKAPSRNRRHDD